MSSGGVNIGILMGRLVASPEIKETNSGKTVAHFSLAVEREFTKDENGKRKVDFHRIVAWGSIAEFAATYFKKGDPCLVIGEIQNRSWTEDGKTRYITELEARKIRFCPTKSGGKESEGDIPDVVPSFGMMSAEAWTDSGDEDLPF